MDRYTRLFNINNEKPPIPELPKTKEELIILLKRNLKVLEESEPVSAHGGKYHPGGVALTNVKLECPFCGMKFEAIRKSGCFGRSIDPNVCPNCNFPSNVLKAAEVFLWGKETKGEKIVVDICSGPKHDIQEDDPKVGPIIKEAAEEAKRKVYKKYGLSEHRRGIGYEIWAEQKNILKEKGIDWKSPAEMNPSIIFD